VWHVLNYGSVQRDIYQMQDALKVCVILHFVNKSPWTYSPFRL